MSRANQILKLFESGYEEYILALSDKEFLAGLAAINKANPDMFKPHELAAFNKSKDMEVIQSEDRAILYSLAQQIYLSDPELWTDVFIGGVNKLRG